jgi:hypothetical protein
MDGFLQEVGAVSGIMDGDGCRRLQASGCCRSP